MKNIKDVLYEFARFLQDADTQYPNRLETLSEDVDNFLNRAGQIEPLVMPKIAVGDILLYRHNGKHDDCKVAILYDEKEKKRYLYNLDYGVRIGDHHLLYVRFTGKKLNKVEIEKLSNFSA